MSATGHDALNGARGTLHRLDVPEAAEPDVPDVPDFTEDLADEVTSELGTSPRAPRAVAIPAALAPDLAVAANDSGGATVLCHRYLLETQIGNGGAATVHRAVDLRREPARTGEGRRVAIKLLRPELRERPHAVARLQREFRQTQAVAHPNVVRFLDLGRDGDAWFIVMELLSGETLGPLLRRVAPSGLPVPDAMRIGLAAGDALAHAHARGVTHGDVKPDNLFLTTAGEVRLIDFGVAPDNTPAMDAAAPRSEVRAAATRVYASPEVLAGEAPEPRDDVFSFACVIHEMVAGRHPFGRRGVDRARDAAVVPERLASLGPARASAISAALALSRAGRPSMPELLLALRAGEPSTARPAPAVAAVMSTVPVARVPVAPPAAAPAAVATAQGSRLTMRVACATGLALVAGILIGRFGSNADPVPAPAPVPQQVSALQPQAEPPVQSAPGVMAAPAAATPQAPAAESAPITLPPPAGPDGLVFFDEQHMVVSRRAVVAPVPLRHLSHSRRPVSVHWRVLDGSARSGRDYGGPRSGVEHFIEGNSFRMLYVPLVPSPSARQDRSFTIELTEASAGMELGPTPRVEITILGES
jgi:serine/threonine protein kinase